MKKHRHSKKQCICKPTYSWWIANEPFEPISFKRLQEFVKKAVGNGLQDTTIIDFSCKCKKDKL